jgi:hypothetical protein
MLPRLFAVACLSLLWNAQAFEAAAFLTADSVAIRPSTNAAGSIAFTSATDGTFNDELAFLGSLTNSGSNGGTAALVIGTNGPLALDFGVDVPEYGSADFRDLTAFYDVAVGLTNKATSGSFGYVDANHIGHSGSVSAIWNRSPGSAVGEVVLGLSDTDTGMNLLFTNIFEIYQYQGSLDYTPVFYGDTAFMLLTRVGAPGVFAGPMTIIYQYDDSVGYGAGVWTNEIGRSFSFISASDQGAPIVRSLNPLHYYGAMTFSEGPPATPGSGAWQSWNLDLFDHDSNTNGVADFNDPAQTPAPSPPILIPQYDATARDVATGFLVLAYGIPGSKAAVDVSTNGGGGWATYTTNTLRAGPTPLRTPQVAGASTLYRVRQ